MSTRRRDYRPSARARAKAAEVERFGLRPTSRPQPGYFAVRLVRGGVEVAAQILYGPSRDPVTNQPLDRSWHYSVTLDGVPDADPRPEPNDLVTMVWIYGRRIERAEYEFLLADRAWARRHRPDSPEAKPREAVDFTTMPLPF